MKILIDESLPRYLKTVLKDFTSETVQERGWAGVKNGKLLSLAQTEYDVFLSGDKNLKFQQNLQKYDLAIIIFPSNKLSVVKSIEVELLEKLVNIRTGDYIELSSAKKV